MFDKGLTTFMIIATSLVMLMTPPGLAFFYGGLGCKKNILSIMMQSFVSLGISTILCIAFGYSMCFSGTHSAGTDFFGIIGNFDKVFLNGVTSRSVFPLIGIFLNIFSWPTK